MDKQTNEATFVTISIEERDTCIDRSFPLQEPHGTLQS